MLKGDIYELNLNWSYDNFFLLGDIYELKVKWSYDNFSPFAAQNQVHKFWGKNIHFIKINDILMVI